MDIKYGSGLLVLLGAGASFDSLPSPGGPADLRPPLTKDLARTTEESRVLTSRYPDCAPILSELRTRLSSQADLTSSESRTFTLEDALADYLSRTYDQNVPRHVMAMRYYIRDLIWRATEYVIDQSGGVTNYTELVRQCFQWAAERGTHVCFVTFNYDPLLEYACQSHFAFRPELIDHYTANETASVVKPHGSVLWSWPHPNFLDRLGTADSSLAIAAGEPDAAHMKGVAATATARPENAVRITSGSGSGVRTFDAPAIPALALPITEKTSLVWPDSQDQFFRSQIPPGTFGRVLTIGWRAAEQHFLPLLSRLIPGSMKTRLLIVTGGESSAADLDSVETQNRMLSVIEGSPPSAVRAIEGFGSIFQTKLPEFLSE